MMQLPDGFRHPFRVLTCPDTYVQEDGNGYHQVDGQEQPIAGIARQQEGDNEPKGHCYVGKRHVLVVHPSIIIRQGMVCNGCV